MFKGIVLFFVLSTSLVFAQSSTIYGNLIRIPFDATQINPADTMGSWENYENGFTRYIGVVHSPQSTFFEKYRYNDYGSGWTISDLFLEEFENQTSESYGSWVGQFDIIEPYLILKTYPFRIENGTWLVNGMYNMAFVSDDDKITVVPREFSHDLVYICTKINDKYLTVFRKGTSEPAYDFYLADLSNSPEIDTTNAEKIYFDGNVAPYKIRHLSDSIYLAGIDSLPGGYPEICFYSLQDNTFHYIKTFYVGEKDSWEYRNGFLFLKRPDDVSRYEYNPADTSFINQTIITQGALFWFNNDYSITVNYIPDHIYIYNNYTAQLINDIDISSLWDPLHFLVDSPYVYIHQKTLITDVKDKRIQPLKYDLQVYPNPFNPSTNLIYTLPERNFVSIILIDMLGRKVKEIFSGDVQSGSHKIKFDASGFPSGIYFVHFVSGNYTAAKKVLLLK